MDLSTAFVEPGLSVKDQSSSIRDPSMAFMHPGSDAGPLGTSTRVSGHTSMDLSVGTKGLGLDGLEPKRWRPGIEL